jgi:hypothetical protein
VHGAAGNIRMPPRELGNSPNAMYHAVWEAMTEL